MSDLRLPFSHLNLCRNPFGEVPPEQRGRLAIVDIDPYLARLDEPGFVVEFLGDSGRGKTTHMRAIWNHFRDAPFLQVPEAAKRVDVPRAAVVFVDEMQFLPERQRRRLLGQSASFVIGTHDSFTHEYARAGLDFESVPIGGVDEALVEQMLARRIEWARRGPGPVPTIKDAAVAALIELHGDDLRAIEHHLYEVFQDLEEICDVQVHHLR